MPPFSGLLIPSLLSFAARSLAQYTLQDTFSGANFFDGFDFFTGADPTHGFVNYVDRGTAQNNGLVSTANGAYIGVDYTSPLDPSGSQGGRQSVRLTSKNSYNQGLFIGDFAHMPGGQCGTWPAFWTVGGNWPNNGEIDIIEGVNSQANDLSTLHTGDGCNAAGTGETGQLISGNCYAYANGNSGCQVQSTAANSYGKGFSSSGGGVYAMEWTSNAISIWFFPRNGIPGDISSGSPNPSSWGLPTANFASSACDIVSHFSNHSVVINTDFCGDWAGSVFATDATCKALAPSCQAYVASNPAAFRDAYWQINSLKVYKSAAKPAPQNLLAVPDTAGSGADTNTTRVTPFDQVESVPGIKNAAPGATGLPVAPGAEPPKNPTAAAGRVEQTPANEGAGLRRVRG